MTGHGYAHRLDRPRVDRLGAGDRHERALLLRPGATQGRRVGAEQEQGATVDDEGGVWVASVFTGPFVRVARRGAVTDTIRPAVGEAVACELGGADGRTLFLLCADAAALRRAWSEEQRTFVPVAGPEPIDSGTIQTVRVAVPRHRDSPR